MFLIAGLFLLTAPFVLLIFFEDKKRGFIFILFWVVVFQTALAFFTQLLGLFKYEVILIVNILAVIWVLLFFFKQKPLPDVGRRVAFLKVDWVLLLVVAIFVLNLWQVHYNYTGKISLATDNSVVYHEVKNFKYPYPYYSDEWYAVALIKQSIETRALPIENPFLEGNYFANFELFFHSFLSEITLLLKINPLTDYTKIAIFTNTLIGILVYLFLRIEKVRKLPSAIVALSLLYITSGANLPGIWHLLPITMGIIAFLIGLCFMALREKKTAMFNSILILLFYPPLIVFYLVGLIIFVFEEKVVT